MEIKWLHEAQRGFIKVSSTEAVLLQVQKTLQSNLVRAHDAVAGVSLDISSAFDRAWHPAILNNLINKGMPLVYVKLIQNYLTDRTISLSYGGGKTTKVLTRSTPQGAVLSPFLWNIFLDTLLEKLSTYTTFPNFLKLFAWADDVLLVIPFNRNDTEKLKTTLLLLLQEANIWATQNKASFGTDKTKLIAFYKSKLPPIDINIQAEHFGEIKQVRELKFLGVIFDEKLTFKPHLIYVCEKARSLLFSLKSCAKSSFNVPASHFAMIYMGAIVPKLLYGIPAWFSCFEIPSNLERLTKVLRLGALLIVRCQKSISTDTLFPLAGLLPPHLLIIKEVARRFTSISQSTFFNLEDLAEIIHPKTDNSYKLHSLLFDDIGIPKETFQQFYHDKASTYPIKPWDRQTLRVTLDGNNHLNECNLGDLVAYTDGSKTENGVGASVILYQYPDLERPIHTTSITLPHWATVYQAEVEGISKTPSLCSETLPKLLIQPNKCLLFVDNQAALQGLKNPTRAKYQPLKVAHAALCNHKLKFEIHWVKGHAGIRGNEEADLSAKLGATGLGIRNELPYTKNQILEYVDTYILKSQQSAWSPKENSFIANIFPTFQSIQTLASLTRPKKQKLCKTPEDLIDCYRVRRFVSGRYPTNDLLFKWKLAESSLCPWCNLDEDSPTHLALECTAFGTPRMELVNTVGFSQHSIADLLTSREHILALEKFLLEVEKTQDRLSSPEVDPLM